MYCGYAFVCDFHFKLIVISTAIASLILTTFLLIGGAGGRDVLEKNKTNLPHHLNLNIKLYYFPVFELELYFALFCFSKKALLSGVAGWRDGLLWCNFASQGCNVTVILN